MSDFELHNLCREERVRENHELSTKILDVKELTPLFEKSRGCTPSVVWSTFPGLGGLSVRRDLNVGITS